MDLDQPTIIMMLIVAALFTAAFVLDKKGDPR